MKNRTQSINFGEKLKRLRHEANIKQEELAEKAGINRTYLSMIENGKSSPTIDVVKRLAQGIGADALELLISEDNRHWISDTGEEFQIYDGLRDLLNSSEDMIMMNPTIEEIEWLKSGHFRNFNPTKQFFKDLLLAYRRTKL